MAEVHVIVCNYCGAEVERKGAGEWPGISVAPPRPYYTLIEPLSHVIYAGGTYHFCMGGGCLRAWLDGKPKPAKGT